jgi:hypothetical protein
MNIGMALRAQVADIGKDGLGVTLRASDTLMQTPQGETGRIVIKLRYGTNRLPTIQGVAVLAGNVQGSMRASSRQGRLRLGLAGRGFLSSGRPCRQRCDH